MGPENSPRKPLIRGPCPPGGRAAGHDGLNADNDSDDDGQHNSDNSDDHDDRERGNELWPCMGKCKGTGGSGPAPPGPLPTGQLTPPLP